MNQTVEDEAVTGQKRNREHLNSSPEDERTFRKSRTTDSVSTKNLRQTHGEELKMEELKQLLAELKNDIKRDMREIKAEIREDINAIRNDIKGLKSEIGNNKNDIQQMKEELYKMKAEWSKEKEELTNSIYKTMNETEKLLKEKIRNNLVITGIEIDNNDVENRTNAIENMLRKELKVNIKVKNAYKIGQKRCLIHLHNFEDKLAILKEKRKLKGKNIYIDSELTESERKIQKEIREMAKNERDKGANVKIRYQKLEINGKIWKWDKKERKLAEQEERLTRNPPLQHSKN